MVMLDPVLVDSEWFVDLPVEDRYLYIFLLMKSDNKIGTIEWNERMINFCLNVGKRYKKDDVIRIFGGRIQEVPNHPDTLIVVDYLRFQWLKEGKTLDDRNPLHRSILKTLARYDLTVEKINEMSKHKIELKQEVLVDTPAEKPADDKNVVTDNDMETMFKAFWDSYPGPRKQDKRKCRIKFEKILGTDSNKAVSKFNQIMEGITKWKATECWQKENGRFVCAPLVWLNNERWEAEVKGNTNGNQGRNHTANSGYQRPDGEGIF